MRLAPTLLSVPDGQDIRLTFWRSRLDRGPGEEVSTSWPAVFDAWRSRRVFRGVANQATWAPIALAPSIRTETNVRAVYALVLAFDGPHVTIDSAARMWSDYYGFAYSAERHRHGAGDVRIVLPLGRGVDRADYMALLAWAEGKAARAGLEMARRGRGAARAWYVPGARPGWPFAAHDLPGGPLDPDRILGR